MRLRLVTIALLGTAACSSGPTSEPLVEDLEGSGKDDLWDGFAAAWQVANTLHDGETVDVVHAGGADGPRYRALQLRVNAGDSIALTVDADVGAPLVFLVDGT